MTIKKYALALLVLSAWCQCAFAAQSFWKLDVIFVDKQQEKYESSATFDQQHTVAIPVFLSSLGICVMSVSMTEEQGIQNSQLLKNVVFVSIQSLQMNGLSCPNEKVINREVFSSRIAFQPGKEVKVLSFPDGNVSIRLSLLPENE